MKAGIDFGTTLTKVAWRKADGTYGFDSTGRQDDSACWSEDDVATPRELVTATLSREGVTRLRATGIGERWLKGFAIAETEGDPIEDEIRLQADGVRHLLGSCGGMKTYGRPDSFLLVSVGTGVSYTRVVQEKVERFPYGNAIGGGFIAGLARLLGINDVSDVRFVDANHVPPDLLVRDVLTHLGGTPLGELVVAHFGKISPDGALPSSSEAMASVLHCVATSIIRDVIMMGMMEKYAPPGPVVFIGSTVSAFPVLARHLSRYAAMIGADAKFPDNGEYAAAIGALHAAEAAQ